MQLSGNVSTLAPTHTAHPPIEEGATLGLSPGSPIDAQKALSREISQLVRGSRPEINQIQAFFTLERQAQPVLNRLLAQYVEGDGQRRLFDWKAWQSALQLSQSLLQACQYFLLHIQRTAEGKWTEHQRWVLAHLFRYRKIELLLRFVRYKKRNTDQWRELHDLYRFALARNLLGPDAAIESSETMRGPVGKIEQQYLQILLLEVMNSGHFSPREALWAYRWFARWCADPLLHLVKISADVERDQAGFVVNLDGPEGLKRVPVAGADLRYFDPAPLGALIEQEADALREPATHSRRVTVAVRAGQLSLLGKLAKLFAERPAPFERRAERIPQGVSVQAIAGMANIVDELRRNGRAEAGQPAAVAATREGDTVTQFGAPNAVTDPEDIGWSGPDSLSSSRTADSRPLVWQVKDRSDTGCRMRGQIDNLNRVIPGSLIAIRESDASPWTVSVVRWFRRLLADHVEIGVEYLGRKPRLVKLVAKYSLDLEDESPDTASRCFAALYLPTSDERPTMPVKTLLLPTHEFRLGGEVTLLASSATYRMRLNEPIQQQYEFVVTSFGVIDSPAPPSSGTP